MPLRLDFLRPGSCRQACLLLSPVLAVLAAGAGSALAAEPAGPEAEQDSPWVLGLALGHGRRFNPFIQSKDMDIHAVLDIAWYGERFFFDNGDLGAELAAGGRYSLNALLTFDNERNYFSYLGNAGTGIDLLGYLGADGGFRPLAEPGPDGGLPDEVDGELGTYGIEEEDLVLSRLDSELPERDFALHTGLEFLAISAWGDWQGQVLKDVSGRHGGEALSLSYSYPWYLPRGNIDLSLGLEWLSGDLIDYYYGVLPEEALPGRPSYRGGSGTNTFIRLSAQHALSSRWKVVAVVEREYLSQAIRHSPIIDRETRDTFFIGLYYSFL